MGLSGVLLHVYNVYQLLCSLVIHLSRSGSLTAILVHPRSLISTDAFHRVTVNSAREQGPLASRRWYSEPGNNI
jgi:hypothetical protein